MTPDAEDVPMGTSTPPSNTRVPAGSGRVLPNPVCVYVITHKDAHVYICVLVQGMLIIQTFNTVFALR